MWQLPPKNWKICRQDPDPKIKTFRTPIYSTNIEHYNNGNQKVLDDMLESKKLWINELISTAGYL